MVEDPKQDQGEMFPDIAKEEKEDIITIRREGHKNTSDIIDMRKLGRYTDARRKERKQLELEKIRKEILEKK